jgi:hypothetical protein
LGRVATRRPSNPNLGLGVHHDALCSLSGSCSTARTGSRRAREVRKALAQEYFNGAQLSHGDAYFTESAFLKPVDQLTRSDFFPDTIGMEEHFSCCHFTYSAWPILVGVRRSPRG